MSERLAVEGELSQTKQALAAAKSMSTLAVVKDQPLKCSISSKFLQSHTTLATAASGTIRSATGLGVRTGAYDSNTARQAPSSRNPYINIES